MVGRVLGLALTLLLIHDANCQDPPTIEGSYIAWGEIVQPFENIFDVFTVQSAFEESYDANSQNSVFIIYQMGKNWTFVKNSATNQTFLYVESTDDLTVPNEDEDNNEKKEKTKLRCLEKNEKQWEESQITSGLQSFEDDDGRVKFSLTQLLNIPSEYMIKQRRGESKTLRGIPAKSWRYAIETKTDDEKFDVTISIESYWSDGSWNTSSGARLTPLGFNVTRIIWSENQTVTHDYFLNVFGFVPNAYDHKFFEAVQGVVCPNRKSTLKFPNVQDIKAISFHSEVAEPDYQELRYIDTWIDSQNQLVRIDLERTDEDDLEDPVRTKQNRYQSEIAIGQLEVVFRWGWKKGASYCEVMSFDEYTNDMQNLFNIKQDIKRWQIGKIFGLDKTSYIYIGQTTKNNIPCHLFQGTRTDWPDEESKITSLWEWCFNINMSNTDTFLFRNGELGLISANVIILSHPDSDYINYRMNHHFYGVKQRDPTTLAAGTFDIGKCFKDFEKKPLQFYLENKVDYNNQMLVENAIADVIFLQKWKDSIYANSGLDKNSLRISDIRATIDEGKVFIRFSILNPHKDLPESVKSKQISTYDSEKLLRDNINAGKVYVTYQLKEGEMTHLAAAKHSVSSQIDRAFKPHTLPPLTAKSTVTTPFVFTLKTEATKSRTSDSGEKTSVSVTGPRKSSSAKPREVSTTPPPKKEKKHVVKYTGHQPGAVAGVAIAMLLAGVSIGAGGTFYKFNGLPECMRR